MEKPIFAPLIDGLLRSARVGLLLGLAGPTVGCVRVYHPLSGLQSPILVDPQHPNFADAEITIYCKPGRQLNKTQANRLCQKLGMLYENQGAKVSTVANVVGGGSTGSSWGEAVSDTPQAQGDRPIKLTIDVVGRRTDSTRYPFTWLVCLASATVLPGKMETSWAQDVTIRDETGYLLASETLHGRIVRRFGVGAFVGDKLVDVFMRKAKDEFTGNDGWRQMSRDLYGQMSQMAYNAKLQSKVMRQTAGEGR